MIRKTPNQYLNDQPCLIVALYCATGLFNSPHGYPDLKDNGYATLTSANRWIRENLDIKKRTDYKRGQRPCLKDLHLDGQAVACVKGHYIFLDHETYWSFFDNENDEVIALWQLKNRVPMTLDDLS